NRVPNACDNATIATGSVQYASGTNAVRSITSSVPLAFTGGRLDVRASVTASGDTQLKGGTVARADWMKPGNTAALRATASAGTLDNVTMIGDLDVSASSASVYILNGLKLDGKATLGSNSAVYFPVSGKMALDGTGEVLMTGPNCYLYNYGS